MRKHVALGFIKIGGVEGPVASMTLLASLGMAAPLANDVALVAIKTPKANLHARTAVWAVHVAEPLFSSCSGKFGDVTTLFPR